MWLSREEPMQLALTVWSEGTDHSRDKNTGLPLDNLQRRIEDCLSPSSPHQEHFLQAEPALSQKPSTHSAHPQKLSLIHHLSRTDVDLSSLYSPHRTMFQCTELRNGLYSSTLFFNSSSLKKDP